MKNVWSQKNSVVKNSERGVAILFSVLLTSVLLAVAVGIANVSYREQVFSLEARDSSKAFFAADTGVECGLLYDKEGVFASTTPASPSSCHGTVPVISSSGTFYDFSLDFASTGTCARVFVEKAHDPDGAGPLASDHTEIRSYGYNLRTNGTTGLCPATTSALRTVNRALRIYYPNATP